MSNDNKLDIIMDEISLDENINYLHIGKEELLDKIKTELMNLKTLIYNTKIEQKKEFILYCSYKTTMTKNNYLDFLHYDMERFNRFEDTYQKLEDEISKYTAKYNVLKKMYKDLFENKNIS